MDAELRHAAVAIALLLACDTSAPVDERRASVPDVEACEAVAEWESGPEETELALAIDRARARGASCGALGRAPAAEAPHESGALTCAARVHALDMGTHDYFEHEDPEGRLAWHRIADAGYASVLATELIAHGDTDPVSLVEDVWLTSDPHCGALMAAEWIDVGLARYALDEPPLDDDTPAPTWWVVVLAVPDGA